MQKNQAIQGQNNNRGNPVFNGPFKRVLLVQVTNASRLVCSSSLIHDLKESSNAYVALLVRPRWAEVAASIPGVDEVIRTRSNRSTPGFFEVARLAKLLQRKKFDVLISPDSKGYLTLLAGLSGIDVRIGYKVGIGRVFYNFKVNTNSREMCVQVRDQDLLKVLGIESSGTKLRLKAPSRLEEYLSDFYSKNDLVSDEKLVGFCLDSRRPVMRWPTVYFSSLAESMLARGLKPVLLGVTADKKIAAEIGTAVGQHLPSYFSDELSQVESVLSKCTMTVGGDSALAHMSRALGIPTVLLYGPSDPRRYHFEDHTRVLAAHVKCRPCSYNGNKHCPESHHDCMRLVSPELVLDALREIADFQTPAPLPAQAGEGETSVSDGVPLR